MQLSIALLTTVAAMATISFGLPAAEPVAEPSVEAVNLDEVYARSEIEARKPLATGNFQAWSGDHCDGAAGGVVGYSSGSCIATTGRHSFRVSGCKVKAILWDKSKCSGDFTTVIVNPGECFNVNTGLYWNSATVSCV